MLDWCRGSAAAHQSTLCDEMKSHLEMLLLVDPAQRLFFILVCLKSELSFKLIFETCYSKLLQLIRQWHNLIIILLSSRTFIFDLECLLLDRDGLWSWQNQYYYISWHVLCILFYLRHIFLMVAYVALIFTYYCFCNIWSSSAWTAIDIKFVPKEQFRLNCSWL